MYTQGGTNLPTTKKGWEITMSWFFSPRTQALKGPGYVSAAFFLLTWKQSPHLDKDLLFTFGTVLIRGYLCRKSLGRTQMSICCRGTPSRQREM